MTSIPGVRHSVSLAMIVRDEARSLARCLTSVARYVDEMVVVDTGSVDATVAIAEAHGARVHHVPWRDDFAAARNAALDLATGDWLLVLDADEWIVDAADSLPLLRQAAPDFVGDVTCTSHVAAGATGSTTTSAWLPRLLPRHVRYRGRVHEQPVHDLPTRRLGLVVAHDGYLPEVLATKAGRNVRLLERELRDAPGDPYLLLQLGRAHQSEKRFVEAAAAYERARAVTPLDAPARHDLVVRSLFCLGQAGRTGEALTLAEDEMPRWTESPDFFFCLGDVLLSHGLAHPAEGAGLMPLIESAWLRCLELGERPGLHGTVEGRGSFLAAHNLAVFYESLGDAARAASYRGIAAP